VAREVTTDFGVLKRLVELAGKRVVDVGCGTGILVRGLAQAGARPIGIEVSESQLAEAIAADAGAGARYLVGRGEQLPLEDSSVDVVVFMRSLHHVAPDQLTNALLESARVLAPGGVVYVSEPLADGDYFELVSMVDDERGARRAAQAALEDAARAGLKRARTFEYDVAVEIADLDALRARTVRVDPQRAEIFDRRREGLGAALARLGEPIGDSGGRRFRQPMRADILVALASD